MIERARTGSLEEVEALLETLSRRESKPTFDAVARIRAARFGVKPLRRPGDADADEAVVNLAVEMLWRLGDIYDGPEVLDASIQLAPPFIRNLYGATWLRSEVCNGGFHQLFWNSTGVVTPLAREAFVALGAKSLITCIDDAVKLLGPNVALRDHASRQHAVDQLSPKKFRRIDQRFYDAYPTEFIGAAAKHLRENWDGLFTPVEVAPRRT